MNMIDSLKNFKMMLLKHPDTPNSTYDFYRFFKSLQMIRSDSIPFVELGTILKYKKPTVYTELKRHFGHSVLIDIITSVDMELDKAENNIKVILDAYRS